MNLDGYRSYSQECLLTYLEEFQDLSEKKLALADQLRRLRNDIDCRGKFLEKEYLERNEADIDEIIRTLNQELEAELD